MPSKSQKVTATASYLTFNATRQVRCGRDPIRACPCICDVLVELVGFEGPHRSLTIESFSAGLAHRSLVTFYLGSPHLFTWWLGSPSAAEDENFRVKASSLY